MDSKPLSLLSYAIRVMFSHINTYTKSSANFYRLNATFSGNAPTLLALSLVLCYTLTELEPILMHKKIVTDNEN